MLRYEKRREPLAPLSKFIRRLLRHLVGGALFLAFFLCLGIVGYHLTCGLGWLDSLLNASMILSGMGPVTPITTDAGKWFASLYALISGVVFITSVGIMLTPAVHRFFHWMHLEG